MKKPRETRLFSRRPRQKAWRIRPSSMLKRDGSAVYFRKLADAEAFRSIRAFAWDRPAYTLPPIKAYVIPSMSRVRA